MSAATRRIDPAIADAEPSQLEEIASIYASVVLSSPATFDLEPPGLEHWQRILAGADADLGHLLIVALDPAGAVLGYAKSGTFKEKAAYSTTCETSVYVAEGSRGAGIGDALYGALLPRLERSAARLAVAGLAEPNPASTALHRRHGFTPVGTFRGVGVKFGRAWDVTWHQRPLAGEPVAPS